MMANPHLIDERTVQFPIQASTTIKKRSGRELRHHHSQHSCKPTARNSYFEKDQSSQSVCIIDHQTSFLPSMA
jgi:hypothetical protein